MSEQIERIFIGTRVLVFVRLAIVNPTGDDDHCIIIDGDQRALESKWGE